MTRKMIKTGVPIVNLKLNAPEKYRFVWSVSEAYRKNEYLKQTTNMSNVSSVNI